MNDNKSAYNSSIYDNKIVNVLPYYKEFHGQIIDAVMLNRWAKFLADHGNSAEEVQMQLDRRGVETFPITIEQHIRLLRECGFRSADILWTSYLQAGLWAVK